MSKWLGLEATEGTARLRMSQRCRTQQKPNVWPPSAMPSYQHIFFMLGAGAYTGPAGGQGGRPKEKTVKKSLSSESTIPLAPVLGGKEEQGNSELGHPGRAQRLEGHGKMKPLSASPLSGSFLNIL